MIYMIWYMIWYMIYDMIYDIWYDIWYDMTWHDILYNIWYDMTWHDILYNIWYTVRYIFICRRIRFPGERQGVVGLPAAIFQGDLWWRSSSTSPWWHAHEPRQGQGEAREAAVWAVWKGNSKCRTATTFGQLLGASRARVQKVTVNILAPNPTFDHDPQDLSSTI